jgi:hypothetical protein
VAAEMAEMSKLQREQQALQTPEDVAFMRGLDEAEKSFDKASGPLETIGALAEYPAAVLAQPGAAFKTAIQSAPNALISGATSLAGYGLGGLVGGAAGIETGPGAILTGIAGAMAGGAVSNTLMEAGPAIFDVLNERTQGAASNMTADEITAYLQQNPDVVDEGMKTGAIRGSVIGAIEALGVKGSGRLLTMPERAAARAVQKELVAAGVDVASKEAVDQALLDPALNAATKAAAEAAKSQFSSAGNIARLAGAAAIDTGSAGVGEIAAQAAAGQDISTKEAFMEMLGDAALSLPMSVATKAVEGAQYMLNPSLVTEAGEASAANLAATGNAESAIAQDDFNQAAAEVLPPTEPAVPPVKTAKAVEPEVTPYEPTTDTRPEILPENLPNLEGDPFAEAKVPVSEEVIQPTPQALNAPDQITDQESLRQEPQDRTGGRTPEETGVSLRSQEKVEEEVVGTNLMKPYAAISVPDLEKLPESDWSKRRAYLQGKLQNAQKDKDNLNKTPKNQWGDYEYNENAKINEVFSSVRAAIQDMQLARPDLEKGFAQSQGGSEAKGIRRATGEVRTTTPDERGTGVELQQQPEALPSVSGQQPKTVSASGQPQADKSPSIRSAGGNVLATKRVSVEDLKQQARDIVKAQFGEGETGLKDALSVFDGRVSAKDFIADDIPALTDSVLEEWRVPKAQRDAIYKQLTRRVESYYAQEEIQKEPITPQGTPTLATEGMLTPGGVGKRDATKPEQMTPEEFDKSSGWIESSSMSPEAIRLAEEMNQKYVTDKKIQYEEETGRKITLYRRRVGSSQTSSPSNAGGLPVGQVGDSAIGTSASSLGTSGRKSPSFPDIGKIPAFKRFQALFGTDIQSAVKAGFLTEEKSFSSQKPGAKLKVTGYSLRDGREFTSASDAMMAYLATSPNVSVKQVEISGITLPEGYVRQGDLYVFQPGATGATPVQAAPSAAQAVKASAPGPIQKPVTQGQIQAKIQELLRAPTKGTQKPAVSFKTQTEENAFARGFQAAIERQGEPPPARMPNRSPKDQKWDEAWHKGWASGQTFVRSLPSPTSIEQLPQTTTAAEKQTPAPSRKGAGAAGVTERQPVKGSIPTVGEVSPETEISSRENLGPKAAAAKKKQAAADEAAKKRQEKQDNATKSSLNSVVGPQKEDAIQGTVTKVDVETAREALTNSGEIPNAYLTNVYESLEAFLADKANARLFPSAYARLQTEKNIEGLYENGQTLIFAKQIQVSNLDRNLATMLGLTPEQAAARRVIAHENGHKAISLFTMAEKRELRGYLMRAYSDEQIAKLVETYDEYADWRTNLESRFEALEELLMRDFEKMEKIPTGGVWDDIVQFLKRVWRRLTGQKGEPTLKNLKDVARLMRNAMKRPAVPLGSFTLKDGGKVKLSAIAPTAGITPEMDAEYLAAVEAGDMEKAQRMVDEAAAAANYDTSLPLVHHTFRDFNVFKMGGYKQPHSDAGWSGKGVWMEPEKLFLAKKARGKGPNIAHTHEYESKLAKEKYAETGRRMKTLRLYAKMLNPVGIYGASGTDFAQEQREEYGFSRSFPLIITDKDLEILKAKRKDAAFTADENGNIEEVIVFSPEQIKSADPITRDADGNVIPLSQRFQAASPDIRFSRPQFASDTDAATSAGNEAARSTIYSERDMDVREAIRRAYEAMPKDTSVAVPIGELFAKTEELMPGVTQDEFSNVLQDLFEDNGAVLQEGEQIIPEQEVEIQAFEKDNPFNELIRKSTEKSPSLGEINGVSKKFVQRVLRPASNFATNNGIRIDDNAPLQVRAMPDGSIIIGYSLSQERFDELQKMAPQAASQYTKDSVIEELIHLSDLIGLRNQWIKSGKKISFDQFVLGEQSNLAFSLIQKADSLNDLEAESLRRILASSLSLYNNNPEIANLSLNELLDLAAQYPYVLPELVRSLIQLKKTGQLTETAFRKIANVLREWQEIVLQWISDGYASAKEGVFGEMLSERIKNAENNLAQFSDTSEINVTTPEGRRAGFVVVMPRAAKASKIPIEDAEEASKSFKVDLAEAGKGRVDKKAKFKGKLLKDTEIPEHNVKSYVLYRDPAIKLIDDLMAKTNDILVVAEALQDPEFQIAVGLQVSKDVSSDMITIARSQIGIEIENRLANEIRKERNPRRKRELELAEKRGIIYYNAGTGAGQALQNRQESLTDPRYRGRNLFNQAKLQKEQKSKDKLDAITGGTEKITDIITKAEEKAAEETTQAEVEAQESAAEDDEYAKLVSEGEEGLEGRRKTIWEMAKMILRRLAMYARADKLDIKTGSKASLSAEQRKEIDELNAILRMPKAERDKAREKDLAEFDALMTEFLGLDSEAKTPEQKKTRAKRKKMVDTAKKRAEAGKEIEGPKALGNLLREMNKARPADSVPLERAMPWRKILSSNPKDVAEYRQRIFEAISDLPSFQNLTDEQKERLADLYAEAWENRKQTILDRMLRDEIKKARDRDEISEDVEKKLQQSRNKILEIVNLGGFNNDDLIKVLGERYGISTSFTEEQKERIQKLADQLQDEDMNTAKRNKLAMEFAVELAGAMDVPVSEIISNWWTSSILFGPQTIFSIGAAFLNGGYSIATIGTRRMLAKLVKGDIQGAIEESILMLKGFARYLGAFKQSGRRAWSYLWTGDVGLLGTGSTDILSEINNFDQLQRFQRHKLLAEKLAKDPRMVRRYVGVYLRFVSRLLTALDAFNVMVTKAGTASLALRMSGMSTDKIIEAEKMLNLKAYKDQVIRDYFDNKAPKTQAEKALVDSYAEAEMYRAINNLGGKMENADYLASESAMTMHPTGFGGVVYDAITGFFAQRQSNADEYLEKMKKDWISHKDLKAVTFLSLAYLRQFAAYNAAGLTGSKFVRYASNKFNQGLSFIPFAGLLRQIEAKDDRIKGKDAFRETIYRNQIVSFVMLMVGYSVIKAIQDEPDDEERGNFWNGGWANLTPDQKKQMLAKGQKEYTMGFKFNGRWYVFNYQNWPLNQILSAIGSMSDQVRFSPEKWDEKSALSKGVAGMVSGVKSTLEIPALSGLQDLVGNRLASKDPTERDLDRLSRVASGWVGGFVPRILKDIDFYTQPELRKYEGLWEKTASHIPIYRRYVGEEYYDILGQQIKRNVIPGSREFMMGPTEPEYKILGALNARNIFLTPANAEYRMVGKGRNRRRLTQEEADAYSLETGRGYRDMLLRYGQRALQMPTERARAFLQDKADEVRDRALKRAYRR